MQWPRLRKGRGDDAERKTKTNKEERKEEKDRDEKQKALSKGAVYENLRQVWSVFSRFRGLIIERRNGRKVYRILGNGALLKLAAPRRDQREVSGNSTRVVSSASQTSSALSSTDVTCCRQHGYRYRLPLQIRSVSDFSTDGFPLARREFALQTRCKLQRRIEKRRLLSNHLEYLWYRISLFYFDPSKKMISR